MPLSRIAAAVTVAALGLTSVTLRAQEEGTVPGAIPDPSTYQGSMEMQRQSDAQDQQFRQQQQQQSEQQQQSYQQQSYGSGEQTSGDHASPTPRAYDREPSIRAPRNELAAAFQRGDYAIVLKILRPAAVRGNASAEHNLGYMYEKGFGVPRNSTIAATWYLKSANQGHPAGQLALGRLYFEGAGVKHDLIEAYKWTYLAGRQTARAAQNLQMIGSMLTHDQMVEAIRRAELWLSTSVSGY